MKKLLSVLILLLIGSTFLFSVIPFHAEAVGTGTSGNLNVRIGWYSSEGFQEGGAGQDRKSGYSYEYLQAVANYTGWEYEYVSGGWSELYSALLNGEIDLLAGLSYTEERAELVNYPAYEMGLESYYIYKRAGDEDINGIDLSSLTGKRVGTLRNNLMTDYFDAWMENTGVACEEILFDDFEARDRAFEDGSIDAFIAVNNNVASNSGVVPVVMVGESSYYLGVTKQRTDLVDQLNKALASIRESNPFFIQSLQIKYFNHTAVNAALSREESEWMKGRSSLRVGCIDGYLPYCSIAADGSVRGVITDILKEWQEQLGLSGSISIEYRSYRFYSDMIDALLSGEIDAAFPVHDSIWSSEKLGIVQTNSLVASDVQLVYRGEYNERTTVQKIAVSKSSVFQQSFVEENYPDSEICLVDSAEACLNAVKRGEASCTFLDSGQAEVLLSKRRYYNLNRMPLGESISFCIGLKKGGNVMYTLLSRGVSLIDKSNMTNAMYAYIGSGLEYSLIDFMLDHIGLVIAVILVFIGLIIAVTRGYHQAYKDSLTGFGNKRAFRSTVRQLDKKIRENRAEFAIAVFDLNGLKVINDTYGHEAGDNALAEAGRKLKTVFGGARLFRFGGDEFIAIEMNSSLEEMNQRFSLLDWELDQASKAEHPYLIPLSIAKGAAEFVPETDAHFSSVFERADQSMYEDKKEYHRIHGDKPRE